MVRIELRFAKADTRIAGNPFGKAVFCEQVKEKINYNDINVIIFPETVEKVASSFVQGFFSEVIAEIGYKRFSEVIRIKARTEDLERQMIEDLLY